MSRALQAIRTVDARQTGGAEELVLLLAPALRERGHFEPLILLLRKPDPTANADRDFGTRARRLGLKVLPLQDMKWRYRWLRALPGRLDAAVIHMHGQRANYFVWLMRRLFPRTWGRARLVATVHGWVQDTLVRKVVTRLELGTLRDCDHVITVSEQQRQTLLSKGFAPDKVSVVRPGIPYLAAGQHGPVTQEQKRKAKARWGLPEDTFVITAVGRLSTEKRFDLFIETCALVAEKLPEAMFMLVGGGKQEANLKELASRLGLIECQSTEISDNSKLRIKNSKLVFTGLTRDMESVYSATDLLMLTSDTEGTPHVLLEAMGSGIPVVSTAVGGVPEFITSGAHGLLVPPGDKQALAEAAIRIHDDAALKDRLIAGGSELAAQFTVERMVEGVEEVYRKVMRSEK
jgi:glycosyltransferase involved in cell wall biosynthesis